MANQLYFSRDSKCFIEFDGVVWEVPVLDGFSFSQGNNTSEVVLSEMDSAGGVSRRGRRAFNDSLAPGEWSFSTYVRPFGAAGGTTYSADGEGRVDATANKVHAVEELLWALMAGADNYADSDHNFERGTDAVTTPATTTNGGNVITFAQSNKSTLGTCNIYFVMGDTNRMVMKLKDAVVNEASLDFEIDGIATIGWSGQCAEVLDFTGSTITQTTDAVASNVVVNGAVSSGATTIDLDPGHGAVVGDLLFVSSGSSLPSTGAPITNVSTNTVTVAATSGTIADDATLILRKATADGTAVQVGDVFLDSDASHRVHVFTGTAGAYVPVTEAKTTFIDEGTESTSNFIRNRLTTLTVSPTSQDPDSDGTNELQTSYDLTLTGGNITITNNVTYITPEELGVVNVPIGHVTGARSVSGSFTCYLTRNTATFDSDRSRDLFEDLRSITSVVTNSFDLTFSIGGASGNRLGLRCATAHLEIPTHSIEDVISLETSFQALPSTIDGTDEITLTYKV